MKNQILRSELPPTLMLIILAEMIAPITCVGRVFITFCEEVLAGGWFRLRRTLSGGRLRFLGEFRALDPTMIHQQRTYGDRRDVEMLRDILLVLGGIVAGEHAVHDIERAQARGQRLPHSFNTTARMGSSSPSLKPRHMTA
jgi:hypothetical protein